MNKKFILSIAAAAALLVPTTGMSKAEAAEPVKVESKVYVYQTGNLNQDQINEIVKKYLNGNLSFSQYIEKLETAQNGKTTTTQKPVQQPAQTTTKKPTETTPKQTTNNKTAQQPAQTTTKQSTPASSSVSAFEQQVVELTNQERANAGLQPLQLDTELSNVAREKSRDMQAKGYFDHNSPTYGSPFDMMKKFGITYKAAGENIAMGQRSPQEVVNAWMNSEGHRKNILNASFTHIGVGYVENGNYWTQMFIGK